MNRFASVLALFALLLGPGRALAQDDGARAQAREHFNAGVARYEAGEYQPALEAFQEAYRLAPHPTVRVNMANCYEHLGRPLEALHHFERFLAEAQSSSPQQRREVEAAVRRLEGQLGEVRLAVAPDGATVVIDDAETRRAPILEPLRLSAGTHQISVRMAGYRTHTQALEVVGGTSERVSIRLERGADTAAVAATTTPTTTTTTTPSEPVAATSDATTEPLADPVEPTDEASASSEPALPEEGGGWELRITTPVIVSASIMGVCLLTAIITGAVAVTANDDFEAAVLRYETSTGLLQIQAQEDGRAAADLANTMSIVSDVFTIATIAAAGATAFFVIVEGMDGASDDDVASGPDVMVAPMASADGAGLLLGGRY